MVNNQDTNIYTIVPYSFILIVLYILLASQPSNHGTVRDQVREVTWIQPSRLETLGDKLIRNMGIEGSPI
jgi:hypothetical protein